MDCKLRGYINEEIEKIYQYGWRSKEWGLKSTGAIFMDTRFASTAVCGYGLYGIHVLMSPFSCLFKYLSYVRCLSLCLFVIFVSVWHAVAALRQSN